MMRQRFSQLLKKDFRLMLSGRFFLLALASLVQIGRASRRERV